MAAGLVKVARWPRGAASRLFIVAALMLALVAGTVGMPARSADAATSRTCTALAEGFWGALEEAQEGLAEGNYQKWVYGNTLASYYAQTFFALGC